MLSDDQRNRSRRIAAWHDRATLFFTAGIIIAVAAAIAGYRESLRSETVLVAARAIARGVMIDAADLRPITLPTYRPEAVRGIGDPMHIIGRYAQRDIAVDELFRSSMIVARAPEQPAYAGGIVLQPGYVPFPFPRTTIGPLSAGDRVNIGFTARDGQPCGEAAPPVGTPFACRLLNGLVVLEIADDIVYVAMTPYQAQAAWALDAAAVTWWGERTGPLDLHQPLPVYLEASAIDWEHVSRQAAPQRDP
ncbi:MAG: flagellar biosynthesis protein FlgA [Chloroflexi bacterium]|jgi:hypothetical protein|nr:flagellar biosynthesis protein FlgA [Chloroflexota bacterium]